MAMRKYTDWRTWFDGLRKNLFKCIGTTGVSWLGTNAASGCGLPINGISWKQALTMFGVHVGFEIFTYMRDVQPPEVTETVETAYTSKAPDGATITQASKTVTTTPVDPAQPKSP